MSSHKDAINLILSELIILDEYAQKISRLEGDKFKEMHNAIIERFNNKIKPIASNSTSKQIKYALYEINNKIENTGWMYNEFFRDEIGLLEELLKLNA